MANVTRWKIADGSSRIRNGAWEVCIPAGNGSVDIVTFSGPNAERESERYVADIENRKLLSSVFGS